MKLLDSSFHVTEEKPRDTPVEYLVGAVVYVILDHRALIHSVWLTYQAAKTRTEQLNTIFSTSNDLHGEDWDFSVHAKILTK